VRCVTLNGGKGRFYAGWALVAACLLIPPHAFGAAPPSLDSITVQAKKDRDKIRVEVDQFVASAMVHTWDRPLLRWNTPVCPLVAGLPLTQGEFMLGRLSEVIRTARAPLAPEKCEANFLVLVTSKPEQLLNDLRKKRPRMFVLHDGMGTLKHFLRTERPVRVWYNWEYGGEGSASATAATMTGSNVLSAAGAGGDFPVLQSPNSRLSYSAPRSIETAIIVVDVPRMKDVKLSQLSDYVAMIGLAEINLDKEIITAPSVLRLFSEAGGAPADGMSVWDQVLLKSLYGTRPMDVQQMSAMETQMVDAIVHH
jgi:hypothetical protein